MNSEITTLDLFSGIGGFSLGLETAGPFRTVAFCEREPFPQAVLRKHWPGVPIYEDVRTIPTDELGRIDLVCGGFPCQPWSQSGHQRGAEDDRDLWPEMLRIIEAVQSRWVVGENVRGFVNEEMGLARTITDLHGIGYQVVTFILPAAGVGAPHRRDRVWIIAHTTSVGLNKGKLQKGVDFKEFEQWRRHESDIFNRIVPSAKGVRGYDGVPRRVDRHRIKALGNAIVPQVAEQIGRAIMEAENAS
jgi:DNA (cytosine-5)-methyltransferase 1